MSGFSLYGPSAATPAFFLSCQYKPIAEVSVRTDESKKPRPFLEHDCKSVSRSAEEPQTGSPVGMPDSMSTADKATRDASATSNDTGAITSGTGAITSDTSVVTSDGTSDTMIPIADAYSVLLDAVGDARLVGRLLDCLYPSILNQTRISHDDLIHSWMLGEYNRHPQWQAYIDSQLPRDVWSKSPSDSTPMENHYRFRLFLSLRRELFAEIPPDTQWFKANILLSVAWMHRFRVLWTDERSRPITKTRPVSLHRIIVWCFENANVSSGPTTYHVLEGNHRVMQWLYNMKHCADLYPEEKIEILVGRSPSLCHWVYPRLGPRLYEWHPQIYRGMEIQAIAATPLNRRRSHQSRLSSSRSSSRSEASCSVYLFHIAVILVLWVSLSILLHIVHPRFKR